MNKEKLYNDLIKSKIILNETANLIEDKNIKKAIEIGISAINMQADFVCCMNQNYENAERAYKDERVKSFLNKYHKVMTTYSDVDASPLEINYKLGTTQINTLTKNISLKGALS